MAPGLDVSSLRHETVSVNITAPSIKSPSVKVDEVATTPPGATISIPDRQTLVLNPLFITQEFDLLRFEAAAFDQLPTHTSPSHHPDVLQNTLAEEDSISPAYSTYLISSPYNNAGHYLDLTTLSHYSALFAKALTALKPVRQDYATADYTEALNFDAVLSVLRNLSTQAAKEWKETSFYVVVFRSQLKDGIDQDWLYKLDYESHREACESGGLLKYWFGKSNDERRNLATCFWHSRADAFQGGLGPWHKKARAAGRELYESIVFSTHRFTIFDGAQGFRFEEWKE